MTRELLRRFFANTLKSKNTVDFVHISFYDEAVKQFLTTSIYIDPEQFAEMDDIELVKFVQKDFSENKLLSPELCFVSTNGEETKRHMTDSNEKIKSKYLRVIKCKDCGIVFTVTREEADWYLDHNYSLPHRCKECRKKKKLKNNINE